MTAKRVSRILFDIIERAEIRQMPTLRASGHSLRHAFQKCLEPPELGIKATWIRRMMGHKRGRKEQGWNSANLHSTHPIYSHPEEEELRRAYNRAYLNLRVYDKGVDAERLRILEESREEDRQTIEGLHEDVKLLKLALRRTLDELSKQVEGE